MKKSTFKNLTVPTTNGHSGPCGSYTKCQACQDAAALEIAMPTVHAALVQHFTALQKPQPEMAFERPVERVAEKAKRKTSKKAKKERGVRSDSGIERLQLSDEVKDLLQKKKIYTIGKLISMNSKKLGNAGAAPSHVSEISRALEKFDRKLAH